MQKQLLISKSDVWDTRDETMNNILIKTLYTSHDMNLKEKSF